jgi:alanine racemase
MIHFSQLETITGGTLISVHEVLPITNLVIDSRKAIVNEGTLFFGIIGERNDGHDHLHELYQKGIRQFVVEKEFPKALLSGANVLLVKSSIQALQAITTFHRKQFTIPIIGITGSNGKTIIKEWLYQLLSKEYNIAKNPGSYNSQVGVPLSVWQLQPYHQLGIFEAGISRTGEMQKLQKIINPSIGIFTNVGSAHDEGFANEEEKIREKLTLFKATKILIYCKDQRSVHDAIHAHGLPSLAWSFQQNAAIQIQNKDSHYEVVFDTKQYSFTLAFHDQASIENTFHCIALMLYLGYDQLQIQERITTLRSIPMRLELKEGINQTQVIDDTYNNDLGGLQISLDFLSSQHQKKNKKLILSDIHQSGLSAEELSKRIAEKVNKSNLNFFVGIGAVISKYKHYFTVPAEFYSDTHSFLQQYDSEKFHNEVILVKGARNFEFEKIVAQLQRKVHGTIMEIDLGAMVHNLNFFKSRLKPRTKIMAMVKAFAYGSGSNEVASLLQYHNADYLGVAYADEGVELRKHNITLPIMVMNPSEESFPTIVAYSLEPEVFNFKILQSFLNFLNGRSCKIHIKLDTGMHRLGFDGNDIEALIAILVAHPNVQVASIFSHLAGADERAHDDFSNQQGQRFMAEAEQISNAIGYRPLYHILNSPGILRLPHLQLDMVRLGIGLYGVDPTSENFYQLKPVASLKTIISQIKHINIGESIGYGRSGKADMPMTTATIAIGYADGFNRAFSRGVGEVLINNKRAKVIGNVCMDMTMVDITGIQATEGDEVIIFGKDLPIQEVAAKINTISYEILTNTSERVKRIFVAESI